MASTTSFVRPAGLQSATSTGNATRAPETRTATPNKESEKAPVAISDLLDHNHVPVRGSGPPTAPLPSLSLGENPLQEITQASERLQGLSSLLTDRTKNTKTKGSEPISFEGRGYCLADLIRESREAVQAFKAAGETPESIQAFQKSDASARQAFVDFSHHGDLHPTDVVASTNRAAHDQRVFVARAAYEKTGSDTDLVAFARAEIARLEDDLLNASARARS